MQIIKPLKTSFIPQYELFTKEEIHDRVNSEDNYTVMKGYPLTQFEDKEDKLNCPRAERIIK